MTREEIFAVICENARLIVPGVGEKEILETNSMRDYGADSLEIVEVVSRSMKQLRIKVPRAKLLTAKNLKDLVDVPKRARSELNIIPVEHMDQVLEMALAPAPEKPKAVRPRKRNQPTETQSAAME